MKYIVAKIAKIAALLTILGLILAGCGTKTGQSTKTFDENFRWVPRVHVDDNSFGVTSGAEYWGCSYDTQSFGYWCPK